MCEHVLIWNLSTHFVYVCAVYVCEYLHVYVSVMTVIVMYSCPVVTLYQCQLTPVGTMG